MSGPNIRVLCMARSATGDRYMLTLRIADAVVRLYLLPSHLADFTKVDLTPDAPNPPRWNEPGDPEGRVWASPPAPADPTSPEPQSDEATGGAT
jgi:hypothetical protein